jgi:hypothetical protein
VWQMIPSLDTLVQGLAVVFTEPTFQTQREILLGWLMCVGQRTESRVFQTIRASTIWIYTGPLGGRSRGSFVGRATRAIRSRSWTS